MSILMLLYAYGSLLALGAGLILAFLYVPSPFKTWVMMGILALLMLDIGYARGMHVANAQCEKNAQEFRLKIKERDLDITTKQKQLDDALAAAQEVSETQTDQKVIIYEKHLGGSPACTLSDGDRKRLLDIR